jgi:cellulose synthase/poly-beta-1,6-N-acetylglucosamine synthase-like glycosyltransferase
MNSYLNKHALYPPQIIDPPESNLQIIVVIPCYDEPQLIRSLESLKNCEPPDCSVEVIVVFNEGENDSPKVKQANATGYLVAEKWSLENNSPQLKFHILYHKDLPAKSAGVGLARKIGMDEAVFRFDKIDQPKGIIACFDADSLCQPNYFRAIEAHFLQNPETQACSIYFEHPTSGSDHSPEVYKAIIQYELHLRYYINAKRFTGFPFAFQTIGSGMAVRSDAYQQQGGMNKRKAGEDFYFLNKFMPLGNFSEIKTTTVIPDPRSSHRVPFGTGKAIASILENQTELQTYAPQTFIDLKSFFDGVPKLFSMEETEAGEWAGNLPPSIKTFLEEQEFTSRLLEIQENTTNFKSYYNRFFRWFNGFLLMKFVHYARDNSHPNVPVSEAAIWLLRDYFKYDLADDCSPKELLEYFRKEDRK